MTSLREEYDEHQCWGMVASIDLYHCHPQMIKDPKKIQVLINGLCDAIKMKKFGDALIERFAEGTLEGYSAMQFIETSSITMHFDEVKNRAFIDIFSCKFFEPKTAENFCKEFLEASAAQTRHYFRT
ncbi:MAG: S-adenosylmethionine decarboxylase [Candidatus Vogelbacteria bacterium]|nr:S-adenosylmethionine decarboxylase [Candidatus Vogelbacteria bacterium]